MLLVFLQPDTSIKKLKRLLLGWRVAVLAAMLRGRISVFGRYRRWSCRGWLREFREVLCMGAKAKVWGNFGISGHQLVAIVVLAPFERLVGIHIHHGQVGVFHRELP